MSQIRKRNNNRGLRKVCGCSRRTWAKCPHSWHFNFKRKGGEAYRFSVDSEVGKHIEAKGEAEGFADGWRSEIRAGTFKRQAEMGTSTDALIETKTDPIVTLASFGKTYFERRGKSETKNDTACFGRLKAFTIDGAAFGDKALAAITEDDVELFFAQLRTEGERPAHGTSTSNS